MADDLEIKVSPVGVSGGAKSQFARELITQLGAIQTALEGHKSTKIKASIVLDQKSVSTFKNSVTDALKNFEVPVKIKAVTSGKATTATGGGSSKSSSGTSGDPNKAIEDLAKIARAETAYTNMYNRLTQSRIDANKNEVNARRNALARAYNTFEKSPTNKTYENLNIQLARSNLLLAQNKERVAAYNAEQRKSEQIARDIVRQKEREANFVARANETNPILLSRASVQYQNTLRALGNVTTAGNKSEIEELRANLEATYKIFEKNPSQATWQVFNEHLKAAQGNMARFREEFKALGTADKDFERLTNSFNKLGASAQQNGQEIYRNFENAFKALKANPTKETAQAFKDASRELSVFMKEAQASQGIFDKLGDKITRAAKMFAMMQLRRYARQMYQEVKQIDAALTQLQIVTNATSDDMRRFGQESAEVAKTIASSVSDIVESSTTYARLGYSLDESLNLAKYTTMYSKVANVDVSAATSNITSMVKGFDIATEDLEVALDKMTLVGNNFPISAAELGQGIQNAGSSLQAAGNSLEQSIALLTAAQTTTQDISKSSTALRTISARIRNSSSELGELNEELEVSYNTTAKYRDKLLALTGVDILEADNKTFKSTYEILKQIASVWQELSDIDRASVTTMLAGTRQTNVFSSLMKNWSEAENVVKALEESGGTLANSYEIYLDSIEGKLGQLKATFQGFSQTVLNSDLVKNSIGFLTDLLDVLDSILKNPFFGNLIKSFLAIRVGISLVKNLTVAIKSLGSSMKASGGWVTLVAAAVAMLYSAVEAIHEHTLQLQKDAVASSKAITDRVDENKNLIASVEESKKVLSDNTSTYEESIAARENLIKIQDQIIEFYGEEARGINVVTDSVEELTKKLQNATFKQSDNWLKENAVAIEDMKNMFGESGFVLPTGDMSTWEGIKSYFTKGLTGAFRIGSDFENSFLSGNYEDYEEDYIKVLTNPAAKIGRKRRLEGFNEWYELVYKNNPENTERLKYIDEQRKQLQAELDEYLETWEEYKKQLVMSTGEAIDITGDGVAETYNQIYSKVMSAQNAYYEALNSGDQVQIDKTYGVLSGLFNTVKKGFYTSGDEAALEFYNGLIDGFNLSNLRYVISNDLANRGTGVLDFYKDKSGRFDVKKIGQNGIFDRILASYAKRFGIEGNNDFELIKNLIPILIELGYYEDSITKKTVVATNAVGDLVSSYSALTNGVATATAALQEQASKGFISDETLKSLLEAFPELESLGTMVGGQFYIAEEAVQEYINNLNELNRIKAVASLAEQYYELAKAEEGARFAESQGIYGQKGVTYYENLKKQIQDNISAISRFIYMNSEAARAFDTFTNATKTDDYTFSNTTTSAIEAIESGINNLRLGTDDFNEAWNLFFNESLDNFETDRIPSIIAGLNKLKDVISSEDANPFLALARDYGLIVDTIDGAQFAASFSAIKDAAAQYMELTPEEAASLADSIIYPFIEQMETINGKLDLTKVFTDDQLQAYEDWKAGGATSADELASAMETAQALAEDADAAYQHFVDTINYSQYNLTGLNNYETELQSVGRTLDALRQLQNEVANAPAPSANVSGSADGAYRHFGAGGTFANGGIARARGTLVGEEAPEIVVNRRKGTWTLVGQNGAQFVNLSKGDIVFSGAQTKALLNNGAISSRGKTIGGLSFAGVVDAKKGERIYEKIIRSNPSSYEYTRKSNASSNYSNTRYSNNSDRYLNLDSEEINQIAEATRSGVIAGYSSINDGIISGSSFNGILNKAINEAKDATHDNGGTGGTGVGGGGSSAKEAAENAFEDLIDWVQVRIERLSTKTQRLVNSTINYVSYKAKNSQLDKALDNIVEEMKTQNKAYETYMKAANDVGLSDYYKKRVQNGEIDLETITDEDLKKKIDEYQKYYELADKTKDAVTELKEQEIELTQTKFENIEEYYNNRLESTNGQSALIEKQISLAEESGQLVGASYYQELIKNSQSNLALMRKERDALKDEFNSAVLSGAIKEGSTEWYDMLESINKVDQAIIDTNIDVEKYQNSINDIKWDNLSRVNKEYDNISKSLSDLASYFSENVVDERGEWTKEGITALSAYAQQMELSTHKIDEYNKAINDLTADYKKGLYSEIEYKDKLQELKESQWDEVEAHKEAKASIVALNKTRIDAVKDGIKKELDAYKELINLRKSELDSQKESRDYQKTVSDQSKKVTDLQKKLNAMANDDSASAAAKRKKIQEELFNAQQDLEDTYYNHSIETQKKALDDEYTAYEENQNKKMESLDAYLTDTEQVVADSVAEVLKNGQDVVTSYNDLMKQYNISLSSYIVDPWEKDGVGALSAYGLNLSSSVEGFDETISKYETAVGGANDSFLSGLISIENEYTELQKKADETADAVVAATNKINEATKNANVSSEEVNKIAGAASGAGKSSKSTGTSTTTQKKTTTTPTKKPTTTKATNETPKPVTVTLDNATRRGVAAAIVNGTMGWGYDPDRAKKLEEVFGKNNGIQAIVENVSGWSSLPSPKGYSYTEMRKKFKGYASGTLGVPSGQLAWINERGDEIALRASKSGTLSYLTKGTSVIPADITRNLMELGKYNVASLLSKFAGDFGSLARAEASPTVFHFDSMVHVDNATSDSIPLIERMVRRVVDDYNRQQNYSLKKYTR